MAEMLTHAATRSLLFDAPDPGVILASMPARALPGYPAYNVAVKHTEAATLALRRMGLRAPSPIVSYYKWPKFKGIHPPFDHQRVMAEFMTMHWRCFNLSEMGTAKTCATLWAADWLMERGVIKKALIIAPLSTLEDVWGNALFNTLMHRTFAVVHGSRDKRKIALARDVDFYIINHEGPSIDEIRELINKRSDINMVIVDEGSKFRTHTTDKYKALRKLVGLPGQPVHNRGLWWLTGTPTPNAPLDAWAQAQLVNKNLTVNWSQFRSMTMMEVNEHIWRPRHDGYQHAFKIMQPAIRFAKEDCLTLPPVTTQNWECGLSGAQAKAYKQMADQMRTELESGVSVSAQNAADRINKLRQILLGSIKVGEDDYSTLDAGPRFQLLLDAIEYAEAKVYVVVPFKGAIRAIYDKLTKAGISCAMVNGDIAPGKRNAIFNSFRNEPDPKVLLCHQAVIAHGLDFTCSDVLVFYGPIYSNDEYRQVVERFNRPGQTRKMTIIRIGASKLEWSIYDKPDNRELTQSALLKLYRDSLTLH